MTFLPSSEVRMGLEVTEGLTSRQLTLGAHVREEPSFQSTGEGPTWDLQKPRLRILQSGARAKCKGERG